MGVIRVLIVDDHELVRIGTSRLLDDQDDIQIVGEAGSGEEALHKIESLNPDVILMDVEMPGMGGIEATRRCLQLRPRVKVIAVTVHDREPFPSQILKTGAAGYLTKRANAGEIATAIRAVTAGQRYISDEIARKLALTHFNHDEEDLFGTLSKREMQIVMMTLNGLSPTEVAEALHLSPKTISSYRHRIFEKLGARNDVGLLKLAVQHGVLTLEAPAL
ncbi:MAG: response regulator [Pseudomonadales bacterium]|nr:response regulator [Pseudomonadales bacterium]